mgnify:CR=1 FL=1
MACKEQTTKKYTSRKSPPYKANECCGETKKGNDGMMYKSKPDKKGVCKWYKLDVKKKSPKKKASPKKKSPKKREPAFFEAVPLNDHYDGIYMKSNDDITKYIKDTNKISGDILFVGTDYESRPEHGIVVVDLKNDNKFFFTNGFFYYSFGENLNQDEIIGLVKKNLWKSLSIKKNNPENALKGLFKWYTSNDTPFRDEVRKTFGMSPVIKPNKDFDELEYKIRELRNYVDKNGFMPSELKPYLVLYGMYCKFENYKRSY